MENNSFKFKQWMSYWINYITKWTFSILVDSGEFWDIFCIGLMGCDGPICDLAGTTRINYIGVLKDPGKPTKNLIRVLPCREEV